MEEFIFDLCILFVGSAILSCLAVFLKQPVIIAYILCGVIAGPLGLGWIKHAKFIEVVSHLGITLLLFLAGLCLHPQKLIELFKKTSLVTIVNCIFSFVLAFLFSLLFQFTLVDSICIALALMFSSTILTIKLLPTTTLHQKRMGSLCISVLILEDLLAIGVLALIRCLDTPQGVFISFSILLVKLTAFIAVLALFERFVLRKIISYVDRIQEVIFVLGLAWCIGIATVSHHLGLFFETGAFFAGVVLAQHKISLFISEELKPLRDFFLVLFFFSLGAKIDLLVIKDIFLPALFLASIFIILKPLVFKSAFIMVGEKKDFSKEIGIRLGQLSEFSILIALLAFELGHITNRASQLIQLVTILTIIASSYIVVFNCPTPIGTTDKLIRD
ncbi:MAG: cation:proton antiporter [Candidatus Omnitrophica bacterium]|nr:cation:proton antiporter [Candidatus Omnitrophota bacterium]